MYVIARNAWGRPTVVHKALPANLDLSGCGTPMTGWSRVYFRKTSSTGPIINILLCKRGGCREKS